MPKALRFNRRAKAYGTIGSAAAAAAVIAATIVAAAVVVAVTIVAAAAEEKDKNDDPPAAVVVSEHEISPRKKIFISARNLFFALPVCYMI